MTLDFSKGAALHRLYGHMVFIMEAEKAGKDKYYVRHICKSVQCDGSVNDWRHHLEIKLF